MLREWIDDAAVRQIIFSFYNDHLFRLVVDYDGQRTEGMTDGDMVEAISVRLPIETNTEEIPAVASQIEAELARQSPDGETLTPGSCSIDRRTRQWDAGTKLPATLPA